MNLEDIVDGILDVCNVFRKNICFMAESAVHHPFISGVFAYAVAGHEAMRHNLGEDTSLNVAVFASVSAFAGCRLLKDFFYSSSMKGMYSLIASSVMTYALNSDNFNVNAGLFFSSFALCDGFLSLRDYQRRLEGVYSCKNAPVGPVRENIDFVLEHPGSCSLLAGAGAFAYFQEVFSFGFQNNFKQALVLNSVLSAGSGMLAYFATLSLASVFHSQSTEYAKLALKAKWKKFVGELDSADAVLSELETIASTSAKAFIDIERADLLIARGRYDEGMLRLKRVLEDKDLREHSMNPVELLYEPVKFFGAAALKSAFDFFFHIFADKKKRIEYGLKFYKDNRRFAADLLLSLSSRHEDAGVDSQIFYFLFLNEVGDESSARQVLKKIVKQHKSEFSTLAKSCNVVLEDNSSGLSRTVVFKSGPYSFEKEYDYTKLFYNAVGSNDKIARPLAYVTLKSTGQSYFALSRIKGVTVANVADKEALLRGILELLCEATLSANASAFAEKHNIKNLDYYRFFSEKFVARVPREVYLREELTASGMFIVDYLQRQERSVIHNNAHSGNFILGDSGNLCLIDFEDACLADFGLDLEQVLASVAPDASRLQWYGECINMRDETFEKKTVERYLYAGVFKAAHLFGRSLNFSEGDAAFYYNNLVRAITELERFGNSRRSAGKFLDAVKRLEAVVE